MADVKYPNVQVRIIGTDGNGFMLVGKVRSALRDAGVPAEEIEAFTAEATSGNYDHLLQTILATVDAY